MSNSVITELCNRNKRNCAFEMFSSHVGLFNAGKIDSLISLSSYLLMSWDELRAQLRILQEAAGL